MNSSDLLDNNGSISGLGERLYYFPANKIRKWLPAIFGMIFLSISLAVFLYGIFIAYQEIIQHGAIVIGGTFFWPGLIALVTLFQGVWWLWLAFSRWKLAGALYQDGFVFKDHKGTQTWTWLEVNSMLTAIIRHYTNGIYSGTTHVYTIVSKNGRKLELRDSLSNVEQMARIIEEKTFPGLYAQDFQVFTSGKTLSYGIVDINRKGIQVRKTEYTWDQIEQIDLIQGVLQITKKDAGFFKTTRLPVASIPNIRVLISILEQVIGVQTGK